MAAPRWSERPRSHRFAIVGAFVGMAIAAVVAFNYAFDSDTIVRWAIMSTGLLGGGAAGAAIAMLTGDRS
jgi:phosphate/sulfate permease